MGFRTSAAAAFSRSFAHPLSARPLHHLAGLTLGLAWYNFFTACSFCRPRSRLLCPGERVYWHPAIILLDSDIEIPDRRFPASLERGLKHWHGRPWRRDVTGHSLVCARSDALSRGKAAGFCRKDLRTFKRANYRSVCVFASSADRLSAKLGHGYP